MRESFFFQQNYLIKEEFKTLQLTLKQDLS